MLPVVRVFRRSFAVHPGPARLVPEGQVGWLRPPMPGRDLPMAETATRRRLIRGIAVSALALTVVYLAWRIVATVDLAFWWVSVPLLVLEIHAAVGLALLAFTLWDIDRTPAVDPVVTTSDRVAVLIPTLDESIDILTPTIAAAQAMHVDHETWVLDDGARPEVARLAADLGAHYWARSEPRNGHAGNLAAALERVDADVIAVLHADSIAAPDFLARTLGYLAVKRVALVQTPEGFYNTDSFEHTGGRRAGRAPVHEQTLLHRLIQPGRNRWNAALWTGTGAIVRVAALRDVGGIAIDTVAPELQTTIRLHRHGWRTVGHNEVLARGLAPTDAATHQLQRQRRATGAMQVLRLENPLRGPGLTGEQRLAYAASLLGWFDAWRWLGVVVLPITILLTNAVPIRADLATFAVLAGVTYALQQVAVLALTRGCRRPILSSMLQLVSMTPDLQAVRHLVRPREVAFGATPKGRTSDDRRPRSEPRLLRTLALVSVFAAAWFALAIMVTLFIEVPLSWAIYGSFAWLVANVFILVRAIGRVRDLRFGGERRGSVRFESSFAGTIDGAPCQILDLSLNGARIAIDGLSTMDVHLLVVSADDRELALEAVARSTRPDQNGRMTVGLEFAPDQNLARADLALALFRTTVVPERAGQPVGRRVAVERSGSASHASGHAAA